MKAKIEITLIILFLCVCSITYSQKDSVLIKQSILLHQKLISNDEALPGYLDENLTYGHSNGWIETKTDVIADLKSGKIKYNEIKEDSMTEVVEDSLGYVRFVGNFNATLDGKQALVHLKVLEIWRKKNNSWQLFARQAVKI